MYIYFLSFYFLNIVLDKFIDALLANRKNYVAIIANKVNLIIASAVYSRPLKLTNPLDLLNSISLIKYC